MGLRINTNVLSITAQRNLSNTAKAFGRALERLASGSRINRAGDDPAGLAISEGLKSQMNSLARGIRNMNDAQGILATAEGAMGIQVEIMQRMRELALQSANGTLSSNDRTYLENEFQELLEEYNRITNQTDFNGVKLLDGTFSTTSIQVGANKEETININVGSSLFNTGEGSFMSVTSGLGTFDVALEQGGTGAYIQGLEAADFDGDGNDDLVSISQNQDRMTVFMSNGDGGFAAGQQLDVGNNGRALAIADVDEDGNLDLVGAASAGTYVYLGNGDGTFSFGASFNFSTPQHMHLGDVNNDGDLDLVLTNDTVGISLGNGDGTFGAEDTFASSNMNADSHSALVDFDGDGNLDLLTPDEDNAAQSIIWYGNGDGTFDGDFFGGEQVKSLVAADLNGDGILDIVRSRRADNEFQVNFQNADGSFQATDTYSLGDGGADVEAADLDGDGDIDLVFGNDNDGMQVALNNGDGSFASDVNYTGSNRHHETVVADFNGDGVLDIAGGNELTPHRFAVYLQQTSTVVTQEETVFSIGTADNAKDALEIIDSNIDTVLGLRASIGAQQNRLESATNNASIMVENLAQAKSSILDTDIAAETAELTRAQILQQAGISVLGQANTSMQIVLELLRF